jgi:glycosyltransferase involved in cell wall biosynthesis
MKRLSIIIPMYNVEPYVERCIRSLEDQDIPENEYEIICINDGSPDNCRGTVMLMQKEFENIILIDQENQGVSRARNNGIDRATGRYLMFIDPDDYVEAGRLASVLKSAEIQNAQISFLGYTFLNGDGSIRKIILHDEFKGQIYNGLNAYFLFRGDGQTDPDRMVAVLFEMEFLNRNNLRYLKNVPYLEDGEFVARILCLAERCIFDGLPFYIRTTRPGSATNSKLFRSEKARAGFLLAALNLKKFQQEEILEEKQRLFLNQSVCKFIVLVIASAAIPFSFERISNAKKSLVDSGLGRVNLNSVIKEYSRLGLLYNRSVWLLVAYMYSINAIRSLRRSITNSPEPVLK